MSVAYSVCNIVLDLHLLSKLAPDLSQSKFIVSMNEPIQPYDVEVSPVVL